MRLGTSIVQMSGRAPTSIAMHALTLDHLSNGRVVLGMGVSGPQVVEGWYGQPFSKPLARTREVVEIVRKVLAREGPVTNDGPHYPLPYDGPGAVGLGKPLKPIVHPLRADIPIWLGAEGPEERRPDRRDRRRLDPDLLHPQVGRDVPAVAGRRASPARVRVVPARTSRSPPPATSRSPRARRSVAASSTCLKPTIALYMGGMGAKEQNFHKNVFDRMGYEDITERVQDLFLDGKREEATALIPDDLVEEMHIVGDAGYVRERAAAWEETGVTTLLLSCRRPTRCDRSRRPWRDRRRTGRAWSSATSWARSCRSAAPNRSPGSTATAAARSGRRTSAATRICAVVTAEFLEHQRSIGNDLSTPQPRLRVRRVAARRPLVRHCRATGPAHTTTVPPPPSCSPRPTRPCWRLVPLDVLQRYAVDVPGDLSGLKI